ncbi:MAG: C40 family peptidase [Desulfitobacterium hafniense]|nr:C40 family peptidase [Desulfitobacterium hafniense]
MFLYRTIRFGVVTAVTLVLGSGLIYSADGFPYSNRNSTNLEQTVDNYKQIKVSTPSESLKEISQKINSIDKEKVQAAKAETLEQKGSSPVKEPSSEKDSNSKKAQIAAIELKPRPTDTKKTPSSQVSRGESKTETLIKNALSLQGVPYLWGGTTRKGFDCSGFVRYVFSASGISLPRTSFEQYQVGVPVSRSELQPGDLVFFQTYKKGPSDVRIYIGGGKTIGASSDGVAIHSLSESYWTRNYYGARRIIN